MYLTYDAVKLAVDVNFFSEDHLKEAEHFGFDFQLDGINEVLDPIDGSRWEIKMSIRGVHYSFCAHDEETLGNAINHFRSIYPRMQIRHAVNGVS